MTKEIKEIGDCKYYWFGDYYIIEMDNDIFIGCKCEKHFITYKWYDATLLENWFLDTDAKVERSPRLVNCKLARNVPEEILMIAKLKQARL